MSSCSSIDALCPTSLRCMAWDWWHDGWMDVNFGKWSTEEELFFCVRWSPSRRSPSLRPSPSGDAWLARTTSYTTISCPVSTGGGRRRAHGDTYVPATATVCDDLPRPPATQTQQVTAVTAMPIDADASAQHLAGSTTVSLLDRSVRCVIVIVVVARACHCCGQAQLTDDRRWMLAGRPLSSST